MEEFIVKTLADVGSSLRGVALLFEMLRAPQAALLRRIAGTPAWRLVEFVCQAVRQSNFYVTDRMLALIDLAIAPASPAAVPAAVPAAAPAELPVGGSGLGGTALADAVLGARAVLQRLQYIRRSNDELIPLLQDYVRRIRNTPLVASWALAGQMLDDNYLDVQHVLELRLYLEERAVPLVRSFNVGDGREPFLGSCRDDLREPRPGLTAELVRRLRGLVRQFGARLLLGLDLPLLPVDEFLALRPVDQLLYFRRVYYALLNHHAELIEAADEVLANHRDIVRLCTDPAVARKR